ncbi:hypothetical protein [Nocardia sp. NPDC127526]|uniref:hypothetical protein n=1 Tax=Nocardia sp. NPDC127526 TaxID=3345393 RepID=UPI0036330772
MVAFDPEKIRALATDTRTHCGAIGKLAPIGVADRNAALPAMPFSAFADRIKEVLEAMDRVVTLHQGRLTQFADQTDAAAGAVDVMEETNVAGFQGIK